MEKYLFNNEALDDIIFRLSNNNLSTFFSEKIGDKNMLLEGLNSDFSGVASTTLSGCSFNFQQLTLFKRLLNEVESILEFILSNKEDFRIWFNNNPNAYFKHCSIFKNSTLKKDYYKEFEASYKELLCKYKINLVNFTSSLIFLCTYNFCIKKNLNCEIAFIKAHLEKHLDHIYEKDKNLENFLEKLNLKPLEFKDEIRNLLSLIASESLYFEDIPLRLLEYANVTDILRIIILTVNLKEYLLESKIVLLNLAKRSFMTIEEYKSFMNSISESYIRIYDFDEEVRKKIEEDLKL